MKLMKMQLGSLEKILISSPGPPMFFMLNDKHLSVLNDASIGIVCPSNGAQFN